MNLFTIQEVGRCSDWAGRPAGAPPKVWPGVESGEAGAASLAAASTAEERARGSAPRMVLMTLPLRKIRKVGMLWAFTSALDRM